MALGASVRRPMINGLSWVPGSGALITLRWLLIVVSSLPAVSEILLALASSPARRPYFTDLRGRLPGVHLMQLFQDLPPTLLTLSGVVILLVLLGEQLLIAGALSWLTSPRGSESRGSVYRAVLECGTSWIWTMCRVVLTALVLGSIGSFLISGFFGELDLYGEGAGWTGRTLLTVLPVLKGLGIALWLALVGSWAFWCRVVLVRDGRRRVRIAGLIVFSIWYRQPLRSVFFYLTVTLTMFLLGGAMLIVWRQYPSGSTVGALAWQVAWLVGLLLQAVLWHWLLRAALLLYDNESLAELHHQPDEPWGVLQLLKRLVHWR